MRTVFETCQPRDEVLRGELREQQFAASLTRVFRGDADAVYGDPATFFRNTYPTGGLRSLLSEALGRLTGVKSTNAPVIRVETSFGGGKTHNLIALYHVCRDPSTTRTFSTFVPADLLPKRPVGLIAGVVGGDLDAANGVDHCAVRTFTLWGEIAYQLAGTEGYRLVQQSDEQRVAPGTQVWEKLIGGEAALIMIDEIAQHLRSAKAIKSSAGNTNLAEQTIAFLMSLIKFAAESPRAVLVYTLADAGDAFGRETEEIRLELAEARSVSARQEHVLTPTAEDEISAIVSHRLFASIERSAAREVSGEFSDYFGRMIAQGVDLSSRATRSEFRSELAQDYPFHPELLTTLNRKTSTIPNFQKTRGVLRLLAQVVRGLWQERPGDCYLIAPHHLNLGDDSIASDLTSRLDRPAFKQVIEADIASPRTGTLAHAQEVDKDWVDAGKPPYARRVATMVFLHSLVQNVDQLKRTIREGISKGIWVYYPSDEKVGYGTASPPPLIEISDDVLLYTLEEAQRLGIKIKGTEVEVPVCPVCRKAPCACDDEPDEVGTKKPIRVSAEGPPAQSFQAVADQCHDQKVKALRRVSVRVEGLGKDTAKDARSLGLAIPQIGKATIFLEQRMVLEFGSSEKFEINFTGSWDRYKRVKTLTDALSQEATNASVRLVLRAEFEGPGLAVAGEQFQTMRDVFNSLGIGRVALDGESATEGQ